MGATPAAPAAAVMFAVIPDWVGADGWGGPLVGAGAAGVFVALACCVPGGAGFGAAGS